MQELVVHRLQNTADARLIEFRGRASRRCHSKDIMNDTTRRHQTRAALIAAILCVFACVSSQAKDAATIRTSAAKIRHVFIIVLENKDYADTFGSSTQDPYLQKTLVPMGGLLTQYFGTGHVSLDNYLSLISGQAPTQDTTNDCLGSDRSSGGGNFTDVVETGIASQGQIIASGGCVYPAHVRTLADQMDEAHLSWKGYMEDMGNDPARENATCGQPAIGTGTDRAVVAEAPSAAVPSGDAYVTRHNPFAYFHSIIDSPKCQQRVVNLSALEHDLRAQRSTANLTFITPNLCNDGHDGSGTGAPGTTCANGLAGGLTSVDAFLKQYVPMIQASPAFRHDGLLIITFDEGNYSGTSTTDPITGQKTVTITFPGQNCCHQQPGPNLAGVRPTSSTVLNTPTRVQKFVIAGYGGDRIGALLLSPFVKPGSTSEVPYNHYSLLRSLEDIFRIKPHLGYAADDPASGYLLDSIGNDSALFERAR
jgi:phosphatidylinositol-3-phosphatase